MSSAAPSARELLGKGVGVAEVEINRLLRRDHLVEQAGLGLVFDIADGKSPDADRLGSGYRHAVVVHADALDTRRRHGIDVGSDEKIARLLQLLNGEQPASCRSGREDDLRPANKTGLLSLGRAAAVPRFALKAGMASSASLRTRSGPS